MRMGISRGLFAAAVFIGISGFGGSAKAGGVSALVPHHAVYGIYLERASSQSGMAQAKGRMVYRFNDVCDGFSVENRTNLRLFYDDGSDVDLIWSFASWESRDGRGFRARVHDRSSSRPPERVQSTAWVSPDGGAAEFTRPDQQTIQLPSQALFPSHHLAHILESAAKGKKVVPAVLYDGANIDNPYDVNTLVMGPSPKEEADAVAKRLGLREKDSWRVRMAFFPLGGAKDTPEFEVEADYREDGVASSILQDFGNFRLSLKLESLYTLPGSGC